MNNALFLTLSNFPESTGVGKKIKDQILSISKFGFDNVLYGRTNDIGELYIDNKYCHDKLRGNKITVNFGTIKSLTKIKESLSFYTNLYGFIIKNNIDFIYYRFSGCTDPYCIVFFAKLKRAGIKCIMEFPTYPYDGEKGLPTRFVIMDKVLRRFFVQKFQYIVTFSELNKIFGQNTIRISNGIDFESIPITKNIEHPEFNLLGVANLQDWHGFDRIIRGLSKYSNTSGKRVVFHIVSGDNSKCINNLMELTKENNLTDNVVFHGEVNGKELDNLFDICDVAIGSLGRHRNNIHQLKTLKNVEYAARGVPFIYSEKNEDFDDMPYILKETETDNPIDIKRIVDFKLDLTITPQEIRKSIESLSWDNQFSKIFEHFKEL